MPSPTQNSTTAAMVTSDRAAETALVLDSQPSLPQPPPSGHAQSEASEINFPTLSVALESFTQPSLEYPATSDSLQQPTPFKQKHVDRKSKAMHIGAAQKLAGED